MYSSRELFGGVLVSYRKQCFVNYHCSIDCPNFQIDLIDDRYGFGIADDMGLEKISCKQCCYNSGKCEDCLFAKTKDCPENNN